MDCKVGGLLLSMMTWSEEWMSKLRENRHNGNVFRWISIDSKNCFVWDCPMGYCRSGSPAWQCSAPCCLWYSIPNSTFEICFLTCHMAQTWYLVVVTCSCTWNVNFIESVLNMNVVTTCVNGVKLWLSLLARRFFNEGLDKLVWKPTSRSHLDGYIRCLESGGKYVEKTV